MLYFDLINPIDLIDLLCFSDFERIQGMSSRRSYSKESRSYYSRSSSCENNRSNSSYRRRPLSSLLMEPDFSSPSLAASRFDDPFSFDRPSRRLFDDFDRRSRLRLNDNFFEDDFFGKNSMNFERDIPINSRTYSSSSSVTRNIPVQYATSSANRREKVYKKIEDVDNRSSNSFNNQSYQSMFTLIEKERLIKKSILGRENRISTNDWPQTQGEYLTD